MTQTVPCPSTSTPSHEYVMQANRLRASLAIALNSVCSVQRACMQLLLPGVAQLACRDAGIG